MVTEQQIDAFSQFAKARIESGETATSLVDLLEEWLTVQPAQDDLRAIQASLRDMEAGDIGRPFEQFVAEFRTRNELPDEG